MTTKDVSKLRHSKLNLTSQASKKLAKPEEQNVQLPEERKVYLPIIFQEMDRRNLMNALIIANIAGVFIAGFGIFFLSVIRDSYELDMLHKDHWLACLMLAHKYFLHSVAARPHFANLGILYYCKVNRHRICLIKNSIFLYLIIVSISIQFDLDQLF